jgi:hypothetical protein
MQSKIVTFVVLLIAGFFALESLAWPRSSVPASQQQQPMCKCCPRVTVTTDPTCSCTVQLQNLLRYIGKCTLGTCNPVTRTGVCGPMTQPCRLVTTAVEMGSGCTNSIFINMPVECGAGAQTTLACSTPGGVAHIIRLDCDPCTCPHDWTTCL